METSREPIASTRPAAATLLVLCTLAVMGAVAFGVSLVLCTIQSLMILPCATPYWPGTLPCA